MALLGQSAFLKALGWALLNSIWQMAILWLVYLVLAASLRKLTAHIKHSLAILLMGIGSVWFAFTLAIKYFDYSESPVVIAVAETAPETLAGFIGVSLQNFETTLPLLSGIYLLVIVFLFFRFAAQYRYTRHISTQAIHKLQPQLRMYVQQVAARMGIKKDINVWLSEIVDTPMTIGFWKPVILMPIASINGLSTQQVEAILLHELAHIRRNDYLVNLMIASIDIILFFNPFSKLFIRTIKRERENSCDDLVLQFQYNAHAYASALLAIEQKRVMKVALGMAATGKNNRMLLDRVKRILNQPVTTRYNNRMVAHLFAGALIAFIAWSNPGNVIVKNMLKEDVPAVAGTISELAQPVYVSAPVQQEPKEKVRLKISDIIARTMDESASEEEQETALNDMITQVAYEGLEHTPQAQFLHAATEVLRDFSITEGTIIDKPLEAVISVAPMPYVPSSSFSYYQQDSSKPRTYTLVSADEKAANESLQKALKALEEIDWTKLEKQLKEAGDKIDIRKLQEEMKKSLLQVDWEKINVETKLEQLQADAKKRQDTYLRELTTAKQNTQMQEHYRNLQRKVIEDQIKCNDEKAKKEQELKNHLQKKSKQGTPTVRKIVYI